MIANNSVTQHNTECFRESHVGLATCTFDAFYTHFILLHNHKFLEFSPDYKVMPEHICAVNALQNCPKKSDQAETLRNYVNDVLLNESANSKSAY